jgi:hypothetical protein
VGSIELFAGVGVRHAANVRTRKISDEAARRRLEFIEFGFDFTGD